MKLVIAGKERSADLGVDLQTAAAARAAGTGPRLLSPQHSALSLKNARTEAEYLDAFAKLLRIRSGLDTSAFFIPRRPGLLGLLSAGVKRFLWKLLRYQHDRMAFQQNVIIQMMIGSLEFEKSLRETEIGRLQDRVQALESRLSKGESFPP